MDKMTIKELADDIGVSKTAINKRVTKAMKQSYFTKVANRFEISVEGQEAIKSLFKDSQPPTDNHQPQTETSATDTQRTETQSATSQTKPTNTETSQVGDLSDNAMMVIVDYQGQLKEKDKQLAQLGKLLDQQQQLTNQSNTQNESLRLQLESHEEESVKKNWWQFWK